MCMSPVVILTAPPSISAPLVKALRQLCMRAIRVGNLTAEGVTWARAKLRGTILACGRRCPSGALGLLAQGTRPGIVSITSSGPVSLYGPTILVTSRVPDDSTLLSNAIVIRLPWAHGAPRIPQGTEHALTATELRNQLLHFSLDFVLKPEFATTEIAQDRFGVPRGLIQTLIVPLSADPEMWNRTLNIIRTRTSPSLEKIPRAHKAVFSALFFYLHEWAGSCIVATERLLTGRGGPLQGHAAEWTEEPGLDVITELAKTALHGWGHDEKLTSSEVGRILTDLGLACFGPKPATYQLPFTDDVERELHALVQKFGALEVDLDLQAMLSRNYCPLCRDMGLVSKKSIAYFEEFIMPKIADRRRQLAEEAARRYAEYKRSGGLWATLRPAGGTEDETT